MIILLPAQGCIWGSVQYDRTLRKDVVKKIEPGKTTRQNILKWFGPPEVLAKKDNLISLPILENDHVKMQEVESAIFFDKFSENHSISEHHIVYYYLNEGEDINGFSIPIPGLTFISVPATFGNLQFSELWVLVNHETGQVEDYVFLEREEK
ncbi:hypothetical protein MJD09_23035 [bacterium]|nr:hypothetical protein [bacterium]